MTKSINQNPFTSLKDAIGNTFGNSGKQEILLKARIDLSLKSIFDGKLAGIANMRSYRNGKLRIITPSPVWRYELELRKQQIIDEINGFCGEIIVKSLDIS